MKKNLLFYFIFIFINWGIACTENTNNIFISTNSKYCFINIDELLSNRNDITLKYCQFFKGDTHELLSKGYYLENEEKKIQDYNIERKYVPFFQKAYATRKKINNTYLQMRKLIGDSGSKEEFIKASLCKNGYNFIHDGFIKINDHVYYFAGKGNWENYLYNIPKGEYPLCSVDINNRNVKLIKVLNIYGALYSTINGNYIILQKHLSGADELRIIDIKKNEIVSILRKYNIIGELNNFQSILSSDMNEFFIFDHHTGRTIKVSDLPKNVHIRGYQYCPAEFRKEWDVVASSKKNNIIILRGYKETDNEKKEVIVIFKYVKDQTFLKFIQEIDCNELISTIIVNDEPFVYSF